MYLASLGDVISIMSLRAVTIYYNITFILYLCFKHILITPRLLFYRPEVNPHFVHYWRPHLALNHPCFATKWQNRLKGQTTLLLAKSPYI